MNPFQAVSNAQLLECQERMYLLLLDGFPSWVIGSWLRSTWRRNNTDHTWCGWMVLWRVAPGYRCFKSFASSTVAVCEPSQDNQKLLLGRWAMDVQEKQNLDIFTAELTLESFGNHTCSFLLIVHFVDRLFSEGCRGLHMPNPKKLFPPLDDSCYLRRTFRIEDMSSTQNRRGRWHGQSHPKHSEILDDVGVEVVKQIFESFMCLWLQGLELNSWLWVILSWRRKFAVVILWGAESWTNML